MNEVDQVPISHRFGALAGVWRQFRRAIGEEEAGMPAPTKGFASTRSPVLHCCPSGPADPIPLHKPCRLPKSDRPAALRALPGTALYPRRRPDLPAPGQSTASVALSIGDNDP